MSRLALVNSLLEGRTLDVGHAVGPLHEVISRGREVVAIDIALRKPEKAAVKADALRMPFKSNVFDSVLAGEVIEHVEHPSLFVQEARRVLRRGGLLLITTPNRQSLVNRFFRAYEKPAHLSLLSGRELLSLLREHAFAIERFVLFPYTAESSEGSTHAWFFPVRRLLHRFLPQSLQEQMVVAARFV